MPYRTFYRFYDLIMGDWSQVATYLCSLIERYKPDGKSILEIACGTGGILGFLSESYEVTGLDQSREMLSIARQKLPHVRFYRQDMRKFRLASRVDVVICVSDSINHIVKFGDWQKIFRHVAAHLKDDGLFIFDVNTIGKLRRLTEESAWVRRFGRDEVLVRVTGGQRNIFQWQIRIFEHEKNRNYKLREETIPELAVGMKRIFLALRAHFKKIDVLDPEGRRPSDQSERLYFVCRASAVISPCRLRPDKFKTTRRILLRDSG